MKNLKRNFSIFIISVILINYSQSNNYTNPDRILEMDIIQLKSDKCSLIGGMLLSNTKCACKSCFSTNYSNSQIQCSYEQRSSTTAGILEFLFPIGIGHFYTGSIAFGFFKMVIAWMMIYGIYVIVIYYLINKRTCDFELGEPLTRGYQNITVTLGVDIMRMKFAAIFSQILFFVFHLIDVYFLFSATYLDGNDMPLC